MIRDKDYMFRIMELFVGIVQWPAAGLGDERWNFLWTGMVLGGYPLIGAIHPVNAGFIPIR